MHQGFFPHFMHNRMLQPIIATRLTATLKSCLHSIGTEQLCFAGSLTLKGIVYSPSYPN